LQKREDADLDLHDDGSEEKRAQVVKRTLGFWL
jgi:hypothetical protein